ncbi:hydrolase, carbon-nitrogen family [Pyramidobacter piscolens W5455]|uniref:Hydrolase, carbon-nitrogen family n=1 Tax=Pyramidobacter piscolens W5455 TaxID=352165 RepID=A0ABM9ZTP9_9BACT|nr:carbon-nitrogen hydrolase family protein [Pyramidobacter piscolens]EFB90303.1 hydrolase, carbon-nitrogen family [Pyramidobacter piscolens W5455]
MRKYLMAVIQMDTRDNKDANLKAACDFIDEAASKGAKFVSFPEVFNVIDEGQEAPELVPEGRTISLMAEKARRHNLWIHCGSIAEVNPEGDRKFNTTAVLNPQGRMVAKYRKLHTFDITLPDGSVAEESARIKPGREMVTADTEMGCLGLSICYDIRFPELYRYLALHGAQILFAPANFRMATGKDHWEAILRARAIENTCYVVAAGQYGKKHGTSDSFGNSMIIDPWGTVVARASEGAGLAVGEIDLDYLDKVRSHLPSLKNRRADVYDTVRK